jgi:hypothetical protein
VSGTCFFDQYTLLTQLSRSPEVVSLREPRPGANLRPPMLRMYLRKLLLDPDEFMQLLEDC